MSAPSGIAVLNVLHNSRVAAISTAAGPKRLLDAGLAERLSRGGLPVRVVDVPVPGATSIGEVAASFAVAHGIARLAHEALTQNRLVFVLSGSCHTAIGSLSGIGESPRGVVWLDCHGDFNTPETTESGLLDGTTLASITGRCWTRLSSSVAGFSPLPDEDVVLIGVRDLDPGEASLLESSGITVIATEDARRAAPAALRALGERVSGVYLHIDLDVLDPSVGMANAFATGGGFSRNGLRAILESVVEHCPLRVVGFTSYDPSTDENGAVCEATLEMASVISDAVH